MMLQDIVPASLGRTSSKTGYAPPFPTKYSFNPIVSFLNTATSSYDNDDNCTVRSLLAADRDESPISPMSENNSTKNVPLNRLETSQGGDFNEPYSSSASVLSADNNSVRPRSRHEHADRNEPPSDIPGHPILPPSRDYETRRTFRRSTRGLTPLEMYLYDHLEVKVLNEIHMHLWWAGRPGTHRPLHFQKMMRREMVVTEKPDLHLIWINETIYIKPLPAWLLNFDFFRLYICKNPELYKLANGFLRSYTRLIRTPVDFKIAVDMSLLPDGLTWDHWSFLADEMIKNIRDADVNERYVFGELRLTRLNHIRRYLYWGDSYHMVYVTYNQFFSKNFAWLLLVVVYLSVILAAMQVVLGSSRTTSTFDTVSYWFGIVTISALVGVTVLMALIFVILFVYHLICTILNLNRQLTPWVGNPKPSPPKKFKNTPRSRSISEAKQRVPEIV